MPHPSFGSPNGMGVCFRLTISGSHLVRHAWTPVEMMMMSRARGGGGGAGRGRGGDGRCGNMCCDYGGDGDESKASRKVNAELHYKHHTKHDTHQPKPSLSRKHGRNFDVFCGVALRQENESIFARKRENKIWELLAKKKRGFAQHCAAKPRLLRSPRGD